MQFFSQIILGLFLGCSTVSLVELIYHPIAAFWTRFKKRADNIENKKNQEIMQENNGIDPERFFG